MHHKKKILFWILIIILCIVAVILGVYFGTQHKNRDIYEQMQQDNEELEEKLEEEEKPIVIPIDFAKLQEQNKDIYAWIRIPGTLVDYPIVQHPSDNGYYLNRTVEGRKGLPGSIYTELHNSTDFEDRNTLIYGHNMKNGTMFGDLSKYKSRAYMEEHSQILIYTPEHIYTYQVFGAVTFDSRHIMYAFDFSTDDGLAEYLDAIRSTKNLSGYIDKSVNVTPVDKIITLSTCTGNKSTRFLVEAVLKDVQ